MTTSFPSTAELLISGDDPRLALDPETGANHYLCRPIPDDDLLRFGASTATTIDPQGWEQANQFRDQMAQTAANIGLAACCHQFHRQTCDTLRDLCQLDDTITISLTESGTTAHQLAAQITRQTNPHGLEIIVMQPSETGRGVPDALALHGVLPVHSIALRTDTASPRPETAVDAEVEQQAEQIMRRGASLLLVMVDGSKSGLTAPSLNIALDLRRRFPERIHLLLDGCQFRFSRKRLQYYLQQKVMVALTGSKFLAGPSFSAALLLPDRPNCDLPAAHASSGLLLRWQIALTTLATLDAIDPAQVHAFVTQFSRQISQRLRDDPIFSPLPMPTPSSGFTTLFPFTLHRQKRPQSLHQTMQIYRQLQQSGRPRVQLGRPFRVGTREDGEAIGALRMSLSAPLIIEAITNRQQDSVINRAMIALDRVHDCLPS